ncbi:hypothetical protein [Kitasatospora sp. NPDC051914]|uniref:hypothetical protein n=1 Tax=Kitasatospora sp. NPDC051914 TaxID=3154945 RepID=UPI00343FA39C
MGLLESAADVLETGTVLGLDHVSSPAQVEAALGRTDGETAMPGQLFRDHGLAEFCWQRDRPAGPWLGWAYSLQLHRANTEWAVTEPALVERYGPLTGLLPFEELAAEAGRRGLPLVELPAASPGCREYWQPSTSVSVLVIGGGYGVEPEEIGTVHRIGGPVTPEHLLRRGAHERVKAFKQAADHLAAAPPDGRRRWLANRPPELPAEELWWRRMLAALRTRRHDRPQDADALADAYLWLLDEARARGTLDALQTALLRADLDHPASADRTVRECLALLTDSTPTRTARDLLAAARPHLPRLTDPALVAALRSHAAAREVETE